MQVLCFPASSGGLLAFPAVDAVVVREARGGRTKWCRSGALMVDAA